MSILEQAFHGLWISVVHVYILKIGQSLSILKAGSHVQCGGWSMSILDAGSSCFLEARSPCIFVRQAGHVYSEERQYMSIQKTRKAGQVYSEGRQSMFILEADSPCLLESGGLCLL
jgi:hypothetical protein